MDLSNRSQVKAVPVNGTETVAIKPQGSPLMKNQRKTAKFDDYRGNQDGRQGIWQRNVQSVGVDRETDC